MIYKSDEKKIKIFIDCRWYSQPGQGVVTYIEGLHRAAETILSNSGNQYGEIEFWYGVESLDELGKNLFLPKDRVIVMGRKSFVWRLLFLPIFLKKGGFKVAHFNYTCPLYKNSIKYINTVHDLLFMKHPKLFSWKHRISRSLLYSWSARKADLILTVSEQSRDDIKNLIHPKAPIKIIPNASNQSVIEKTPESPKISGLQSKNFILTVGRVEPRKNYPGLVQAFTKTNLAHQGVKLVIVGFCSDEFAKELIEIQGKEGVHWCNRVSDGHLSWLYGNALAFVYPSMCEGFGIPVIEAIQAGLPIALSNTYPLDDVLAVAEEKFDPTDVDAIAESLRKIVTHNSSNDVARKAVERYTWANSAKQYLAAINQVLLNSGKVF
jgi:glycosyltransferase involved in cell wall biosynthesis